MRRTAEAWRRSQRAVVLDGSPVTGVTDLDVPPTPIDEAAGPGDNFHCAELSFSLRARDKFR
jgi:hypothetical protein